MTKAETPVSEQDSNQRPDHQAENCKMAYYNKKVTKPDLCHALVVCVSVKFLF